MGHPNQGKFLRLSDLGQAKAGDDNDYPVVMDANGELVMLRERPSCTTLC